MKIFTIILSIYFLGLNFVPCSDILPSDDEVQVEISQTADSEHNHNESDLCPPFCHCHCCHVHTIDFGLMAFEPVQPSISKNIFAHFQNAGKDYHNALLQPPRA